MGTVSPLRPRIAWVDAAKAYGIFLVFYGHFVAEVGTPASLTQQKLVYAFHMPLFILLSGCVAKSAPELPRLGPFFKRQVASRLLPVVFFSVLMMPLFPLEKALRDYLPSKPSLLQVEWIDDWPELCRRLNPSAQGELPRPGRKVWESLPAPVQGMVAKGAAGHPLEKEAQAEIAAALNQVLSKPDLFVLEDFSGIRLSDKNRQWLSQDRLGLGENRARRHNMDCMWQGLYPEWAGQEQSYWSDWLWRAKMTLRGYTEFNLPVWFLVCLFTVELMHFAVVRFLTSRVRLGLAIPLFFAAGWWATANMELRADLWFARESVLLYAFYLLGYLLRRTEVLERRSGWWSRWPLLVVGSTVLLLTFDLNPGSKVNEPVVLINLSQHGDPLYFVLAAAAGCLAVVGLARLTPAARAISFTGRHTLILMGLNGIFYNFVNAPVVNGVNIPSVPGLLVLWCSVVTLASLAVCMPVVWLLDRYVPQLVGRPRVQGPFLPSLA